MFEYLRDCTEAQLARFLLGAGNLNLVVGGSIRIVVDRSFLQEPDRGGTTFKTIMSQRGNNKTTHSHFALADPRRLAMGLLHYGSDRDEEPFRDPRLNQYHQYTWDVRE
jgi:hypothetical protein